MKLLKVYRRDGTLMGTMTHNDDAILLEAIIEHSKNDRLCQVEDQNAGQYVPAETAPAFMPPPFEPANP